METQRKRERFLFFLVERGSFYLQPDIISIYLPLTISQRGSLWRSDHLIMKTGMAHLLAINGLHISMIKGMLYLVGRKLFGFRGKLLKWVHFNYLGQVLVLVVLYKVIYFS